MRKLIILIFITFSFNTVIAQKVIFTKEEKTALDSMLQTDDFFNMIRKGLKPKSFFEISLGLGNSYFSVKNKRLEASQLESRIVFTPAVGYVHKGGLGISVNGFLSSFNGKTGFYQFGLTPSYSILKNKKVSATVSYTRNFRRKGYEAAASPIQNDLFGSGYLKKLWLEPGLSIGFSGGRNTEYNHYDTTLFAIRRIFTDTVKTHINVFSLTAFVQHSFEWLDILKKGDGISIAPKLMINAGSNRYTEKHYNPYANFFRKILQRRQNLGRLQSTTSFELQSLACSLDVNYIIGKFGFEPQVYLDYYLPETTDRRLTCIGSFSISYDF
jgi:hypothetical protein